MEETCRGQSPRSPPSGMPAQDVEEEEIEKFFVLLENIKGMRDILRMNECKRLKKEAAPPPWKPAFEMEDFRDHRSEAESTVSSAAAAARVSECSTEVDENRKVKKEEGSELEKSSTLNLSLAL